jgi:hypothetical protein
MHPLVQQAWEYMGDQKITIFKKEKEMKKETKNDHPTCEYEEAG